jgi:hypothetical protein
MGATALKAATAVGGTPARAGVAIVSPMSAAATRRLNLRVRTVM